uniref:Integrase catalytic domain-containing protein n=1 Tax=Strigamia maritima TaxID=126957 RepID=T1J106_STRMM
MKDDVKEWIKECEPCQRAKVEHRLPMGMMEIAKPRHIFKTIYTDYFGKKLKSTGGNCYAFVMVDAGSCWLDVLLTEMAEVDTTIAQIVKFTKRWGYPRTIVSDNATTFRSERFQAKCAEMGIVNKYISAYHPQGNLAERLNQALKTCILAYIDGHQDWDKHI